MYDIPQKTTGNNRNIDERRMMQSNQLEFTAKNKRREFVDAESIENTRDSNYFSFWFYWPLNQLCKAKLSLRKYTNAPPPKLVVSIGRKLISYKYLFLEIDFL